MTDSQKHSHSQAVYAEDEISLYDLYRILIRHLRLILIVLVAVVIICAVYILLTPRVYQVSVQIREPLASEVYLTNLSFPSKIIDPNFQFLDEQRITNPSPKQVFMDYLRALNSNAQWQLFRTDKGFLSHEQKQQLPGTNPVSVQSKSDSETDNATITYRTNATTAGEAKALQAYLDFTQRTVANELRKQLSAYLAHERNTLEIELQVAEDTQRHIAEHRADKLAKEVALAKKLHVLQNLRVQFSDQVNSTTLEKQHRLALLKRITILHTGFHTYRRDGNIANPVDPVKPRKKLVLGLGVVFGLFLGFFAAFIAEFISRTRKETTHNA